MKKVLFTLFVTLSLSSSAFATVESDCIGQGKSLGLDKDVLVPLCSGGKGTSAIYCYRDSTVFQGLTKEQALELCRPKYCIVRNPDTNR